MTFAANQAQIRFPGRDGGASQRCTVTPAVAASLHELLRVMGAPADAPATDSGLSIPVWRVRPGAVLLHEGARPGHVYVVRSGSFKCLKTSEDGYEQVLTFAGPGEVLGFEARYDDQYPNSVVCLEDATVFALPLAELDGWRRAQPALDHRLQVALSRQLASSGQIAEMMSAVAAEVRLARFLVWLSGRMVARGQSACRLYLRMNRRDIASFLGVAHETVSRAFGALSDWGLLDVKNRDVEILDPAGLRACTRSTRGLADETPRRRSSAAANTGLAMAA